MSMNTYGDEASKPAKHKKATNRDVAKLAGVSIATVSYVMNGRNDQHISEATKKKVYQAVNFLNYAPNPYAVGLNTKQLQRIIIRSSANVSALMEYEILHFMRLFNSICGQKGYELDYSVDKRAIQLAASACICFDMSNSDFYTLGNENYIPVIAVDCLINDPIFYQVNVDYNKLNEYAEKYFGNRKFTYVCITPQNEGIAQTIKSSFENTLFVSRVEDIAKATKEKNVFLTQASLFSAFNMIDGLNVCAYDKHLEERGKKVMDCIYKALDRLNVLDEDHYILVD